MNIDQIAHELTMLHLKDKRFGDTVAMVNEYANAVTVIKENLARTRIITDDEKEFFKNAYRD